MEYLVVLDADTIAGASFLAGTHNTSVIGNPAIVCSEVDLNGPFVRVVWESPKTGQSLAYHFPHQAVAIVVQLGEDGQKSVGFVPST